ncbi:uncharacterized protein EI90DRAFT_3117704 [Cantharellus anzutake]|uniref:uncharacterized protein n=1 Tax=Cantharellus anzutake TaxID=1750568 RepID=UPI00190662A3|nr:uncharacterized protein EI90DRAFT_3117704 [Cantharellus anzutake]KAF8339930.1 hypothetical protein EI90DRAFT_3117704 [Cantharellus anzutake]
MSSLPSNDKLRQHLTGLYLGTKKDVLKPPPVVLHGIFTISRFPFKLLPDGGFRTSTVLNYFNNISLQEAMARTNAWAHLERVQDKDLLGYSDFPNYVKNLKGFEGLMTAPHTLEYSLISDQSLTGPQIKIIHRMFESCWDTIPLPTTPQKSADEATSKIQYQFTPGVMEMEIPMDHAHR